MPAPQKLSSRCLQSIAVHVLALAAVTVVAMVLIVVRYQKNATDDFFKRHARAALDGRVNLCFGSGMGDP